MSLLLVDLNEPQEEGNISRRRCYRDQYWPGSPGHVTRDGCRNEPLPARGSHVGQDMMCENI